MPGEDEEPIEGKASPMVGAKLLTRTRKATVLNLLEQQTEVTA